jgi:peptide-methionine (R)-S-oxide reductase
MQRIIRGFAIVCLLLAASCDHSDKQMSSTSSEPMMLSSDDVTKIVKSDEQWKQLLTPDQYYILREKGTEPSFHNAYYDNHEPGIYVCAACGLKLFSSDAKYDSHTGWPSFFQPIAPNHILTATDADGVRTEVLCARCGGHLGHVFDDGPPPTGLRYCMNSGAMKFVPGPTQ